MLRPYLKIWEWELIFGCAVKAISSPGVRSLWVFGSEKVQNYADVINEWSLSVIELPSKVHSDLLSYTLLGLLM